MSSTLYSCQILMKLEFSRQIFEKSPNIKFHENPSSGSRVVPCGLTDMKLTVPSRNFANAPLFSHLFILKHIRFALCGRNVRSVSRASHLHARTQTFHRIVGWIFVRATGYLLRKSSFDIYLFLAKMRVNIYLFPASAHVLNASKHGTLAAAAHRDTPSLVYSCSTKKCLHCNYITHLKHATYVYLGLG
jgi:hypothetical protein